VVGASTVSRDISERVDAQRARAWSAMVTEHSADAIIAIDAVGIITAWNPAAERLFGVAEADAIGSHPSDVVHSGEPAQTKAIFRTVLQDGRAVHYEAQRVRRDGRRVTVQVSIAPIHEDGVVTGAVASLRDVTDARRAEERFRQAEAREAALERELEQARRLETVGQLAGGVAHDFNNMLGVIMNLAAFAADELPEGSQARGDIEEIQSTARRGAALVRQLLMFSRRDIAAPDVLEPAAVVADLHPLLQRAVHEGVELVLRCDADAWRVHMDRAQLEQVVLNLVVNARDAALGTTRVVVEVRNTIIDDAFTSSRTDLAAGAYVTLVVSDTGTGMPPEVVDRAFEPFFTTKPQGEGTGLGLSTVYGITKSAGGHVAIYSEVGRGTSVKVHLPATDAPADVHAPAAAPPTPAAHGERILVIEDHPDVQHITARILRNAGYEVSVADDPADAAQILNHEPRINALVTDVILPGRSGVELATSLRSTRPELRVLYTSGYSHSLLTTAAIDQPHTAFLEKPFTAAALEAHVHRLLAG
jgi:two-component system, cell cycle sensor histidine kinase and response regulator CckA